MIVSMHLPKTAGPSLRKALIERFRRQTVCCYQGLVFNHEDPILEFEDTTREHSSEEEQAALVAFCANSGARCFHGHFLLPALHDVFEGAQYITSLRHPLDRCVSAYNHLLANRPSLAQHLTFARFVEIDTTREIYLKAGVLELFDDLEFIGITEQYERSLELLARRFPQIGSPTAERANARSRTWLTTADLSDSVLECFLQANEVDLAIYDAALKRFEVECEVTGV